MHECWYLFEKWQFGSILFMLFKARTCLLTCTYFWARSCMYLLVYAFSNNCLFLLVYAIMSVCLYVCVQSCLCVWMCNHVCLFVSGIDQQSPWHRESSRQTQIRNETVTGTSNVSFLTLFMVLFFKVRARNSCQILTNFVFQKLVSYCLFWCNHRLHLTPHSLTFLSWSVL